MRITMIVATAENGVIGKDNQMPWRLPSDLKHFKQTTLGHAVVMGRKTFTSIGKALPERLNIVITKNPDFMAENCEIVASPEAALAAAKAAGYQELMVIGGGEIYKIFEPLAAQIIMTKVCASPEGDTFFALQNPDDWQETNRVEQAATEKDSADMVFITLTRRA
ncbi:MAG: dihydrofolate reductase [Parvibaculales bacterium]